MADLEEKMEQVERSSQENAELYQRMLDDPSTSEVEFRSQEDTNRDVNETKTIDERPITISNSQGKITTEIVQGKNGSQFLIKLHNDSPFRNEKPRKVYQCSICMYKNTSVNNLRFHMKSHNSVARVECELCDYTCKTNQSLRQHMRSHIRLRPYKCTECDYACSQKVNIRQHMRKHTGEKPYKCHYCDYKGAQQANLNQHLLKHTGEKPFKCEFCDYECSQKGNLINHRLRHLDEDPYRCKICKFSCKKRNQLLKHSQNHAIRMLKMQEESDSKT